MEEARDVSEFIDVLSQCKKRRAIQKAGKENILLSRGQVRDYGVLKPSIYHSEYNIQNEDCIFYETLAEFPGEMANYKTTIEKLIVMQHYEIPTRLLDVSKNPLISLFFACYQDEEPKKQSHEDGIVSIFSVPRKDIKYCGSDSVCILANLCKRPYSFDIRNILNYNKEDFNKEDEISDLVHDAQDDKPFFQHVIKPETIGEVICLFPSMNNTRIIRQDGYFFIFGIDGEKKKCASIKESWKFDKIKIPWTSKKSILEELDALNINESYLYADFRHFGKHLQSRYPRNELNAPQRTHHGGWE